MGLGDYNPGGFRIYQGDTIALAVVSSKVADLEAQWWIEYDDGERDRFDLNRATTGSALATERFGVGAQVAKRTGTVVAGSVRSPTVLVRGQLYYRMLIGQNVQESRVVARQSIGSNYLYSASSPYVGIFRDPGPGAGVGHIQNRVIADDVTPADIEHTFGITNLLRRIDGFILYYHCSGDVADRVLRVSARDFGDGLPTGMTSGGNTLMKAYPSAGNLTLSANQEGTIYVNANTGKSFAVSLDNGTQTIENTSTNPDPFPYWAQDQDVGELGFAFTDEEAADRMSIYIIEEDWVHVT